MAAFQFLQRFQKCWVRSMTLKTFDEMLVQNATIQLALYGIAGVYQPGVLDRDITLIIEYVSDDDVVEPVQRRRGPRIEIQVANNSTTGITPGEFTSGQKISAPPRSGESARNFHLARIIEQDAGMVTFEAH